MIPLNDALAGVHRLGLDTSPVIYFVEANPAYDTLVTEIFQRIAGEQIQGITSAITLLEVLVHPILKNNTHLQDVTIRKVLQTQGGRYG
jgi:hypothetical protein